MGNCCDKGGQEYECDSDDSDFLMEDMVGDLEDDIDPELLENASLPELFLELDRDGTGLVHAPS